MGRSTSLARALVCRAEDEFVPISPMPEFGKILVIVGIVIVVLGVLLSLGLGNWMGKLPGDIRIDRGNSAFYFPIVTCIVISIVLSLVFSLFRR
jgi:hypothetical protein